MEKQITENENVENEVIEKQSKKKKIIIWTSVAILISIPFIIWLSIFISTSVNTWYLKTDTNIQVRSNDSFIYSSNDDELVFEFEKTNENESIYFYLEDSKRVEIQEKLNLEEKIFDIEGTIFGAFIYNTSSNEFEQAIVSSHSDFEDYEYELNNPNTMGSSAFETINIPFVHRKDEFEALNPMDLSGSKVFSKTH